MKFIAAALALSTAAIAQNGDGKDTKQVPPIPADQIPPAPYLSAADSLATMEVIDGFEMQLVAEEPMVKRPVAMKFDADGSLWVVEMEGYMPDLDATGEEIPAGSIAVLRDLDGDGKMDERSVFLDKILLPRAVALFEDGVLYADQDQLYFTEREGLKPGKTTVVDAEYAVGGNVEHKPNALMRGLDNWIYNSKSAYRYKRQGDEWIKEATTFRGQWGISQDNYGRLFHNSNSTLAVGEFLPPNLLRANANAPLRKLSVYHRLADNRIHPIRINPGVNRAYQSKKNGYNHDTIDPKTGMLRTPTAAAGLEVYRGHQYPAEFADTLFITAPCGNLISSLRLSESNDRIVAENPFPDKSVVAATDERFRPVALANAPDGTLYVADFYHGIIQHKTYLTSYLRQQYESRGLDKPGFGSGRIYRLVHKSSPVPEVENLSKLDSLALVERLKSPNGWTRDTAQRLLVERADAKTAPALRALAVAEGTSSYTALHALHTLDGIGAITDEFLSKLANQRKGDDKVIGATIALATDRSTNAIAALKSAIDAAPDDSAFLLPHKIRALTALGTDESLAQALELLKANPKSNYAAAAAIAGLEGKEAQFFKLAKSAGYGKEPKNLSRNNRQFASWMAAAIDAAAKPNAVPGSHLKGEALASFNRGKPLYAQNCMGCHGEDGAGLDNLGPHLTGSDWVTGDPRRLSRILLHGLTGPITLNGKSFSGPAVMPGLFHNPTMDDQKLADVITYIRNGWENTAGPIEASFVGEQREKTKSRNGAPYTEAALIEDLKNN